MPLNSVNTNVGAMAAVRQFAAARVEHEAVQRRVATGLKVSSARDNGAVWSIAQGQRSDIRGLSSIMGSLQRGRSALDVAIASGEIVSDLLLQMKEKALAASEAGLNAASRTALNNDFVKLRDQITRTVEGAQFNGLNLIDDDAEDMEVLAGLEEEVQYVPGKTQNHPKKGTITKPGSFQVVRSTLPLNAEYLYLGSVNVTVGAAASLSDVAALPGLRAQLNASIANVSSALTRLGASAAAFDRQQTFLLKLQDGLTKSVGDLVDADLSRESARAQALQTRERLGVQAMGVANSAPGALLQLFRD